MKTLYPDPLYEKPVQHSDNRNMALISNCSEMRTLFVDIHAPLYVSRDAAGYQIRSVT